MMSRRILRLLVLATSLAAGCDLDNGGSFRSSWDSSPDRRWVGPAFWANRLQDWRVANGRLESVTPLPMRTAHLLTRQLGDRGGDVELSMTVGLLEPSPHDSGRSSAGFLIGAGRGLDYRAAALIHHSRGPSAGLYAGVDTEGRAFLRDLEHEDLVIIQTETPRGPVDSVSLVLTARPRAGAYEITLRAALWNAATDTIQVTTAGMPRERLTGNVALVADARDGGRTRFWFSDFTARGMKLEHHEDRAVGPILGTQHTLSRGRLRLTAQFMPIGPDDNPMVELQAEDGGVWRTVASTEVVVPSYTATFTVDDWDDTRDAPFRVVYELVGTDGPSTPHYANGTIRRDPRDADDIIVAAFTGNHNVAVGVDRNWFPWDSGVWFPHTDIVRHVQLHDPDFLFFSGDQVYEGASPTRADFERPYEDYLYKWYLWYWAFGELTAEIPSVTIPDDHDVFHGNVWGAGGKATPPGTSGAAAQDAGGYKLPADWVNMVQRTQTSHLPDPYNPTPDQHEIGVYYTDILYGGVSFAVLEDRKFKSAPKGLLPEANVWNGWPLNPRFDAQQEADVSGAVLLGEGQLAFLEDWAADWAHGTWMKVVLSQTIFANVATLPDTATTGSVIPSLPILEAGEYATGERVVSDLDSNGWPQSGRSRALRVIRKGFAVHLAGDQHLGSTIQYGVDTWRDAGFALCVPSIANFWPRRWYPPLRGQNSGPVTPRYTGDYEDGFGNKITVHAVSNPRISGRKPARLHDRAPGYGIARFTRATRQISLEAWPRWADPSAGDGPYAGWPVTFEQQMNYGRERTQHLPTIDVRGVHDPVVRVVDEQSGETVYTIRITGNRFRPWAFSPGIYTVYVGEPGTEHWKSLEGLESTPQPSDSVAIDF
jgi:hypothetical protein